jgi:thiosulfate reductase cytochrome b subunit
MATPAKLMKRHPLWVRATHWLNAALIVLLLGTGLNIFNAHPSLYWGIRGTSVDTEARWLQIGTIGTRGKTIVGDTMFDTTGVLGRSLSPAGTQQNIAVPHWATIPGWRNLGVARNWHFFAAWLLILNGLAYLLWGLFSGGLRRRLLPSRADLAPASLWADIKHHLTLRFPKDASSLRYQPLQKLAYSSVVLLLLPLMIFSGLGMSPGVDASWPWLLDAFGGRQSARSVHFLASAGVVLFVLVHLAMLLAAGPWRLMRGMITGWQRVETSK